MSADQPRRLGRGLEALISNTRPSRDMAPSSGSGTNSIDAVAHSELRSIRITDIAPNHFQPRRTFAESELAELESSIRANGLLQPITVRVRKGGKWELVAGERRLRACTRLGWTEIPAVVRELDDRAMLTLALVENLQRTDLNPLEEAEGYQRLIGEFELTQQQVADAVGKDRTTVTNLLRVLTLPAVVRQMVERGHLTAGHARALLVVKDERGQIDLANEVVARQLSVRQAEARAREIANGDVPAAPSRTGAGGGTAPTGVATADPAVRRIEELLRKQLQTDVHVHQLGNERGVLRISFYSPDDLERLLELIIGKNRSDYD